MYGASQEDILLHPEIGTGGMDGNLTFSPASLSLWYLRKGRKHQQPTLHPLQSSTQIIVRA